MQKKKIVLISHHAASLLNFRGDWIHDLCNGGARVLCLAPDYQDEDRAAVRRLGAEPVDYNLQRTGMNPLRDLFDILALTFSLRRLQPDAQFVFSVKPVIYGTLAGWLAKVPRRVAMIEGAGYAFASAEQPLRWRQRTVKFIVRCLYRLTLPHAHLVIFLNADDQHEFIERRLVNANRAALLGGIGVDLDVWTQVPPVRVPITFVLVARLLREKGVVEFAEAARRVRGLHPDTRFLLLGGLDTNPGGLSLDEVQAWVDEGILEWPGHVPVRLWLEKTSVFVLPSFYREGVPRSTQEAMSMGRAVITTDSPGCRDTVIEGVNGYLVPVRDADAVVRAMLSFIEDPDKVVSMGQASRLLAEERFDVRQVNARLSEWLWDTKRVDRE